MPHDFGYALVSKTFPGRYRMLLVPGHEQALLLLTHPQVISVVNVEVGAGDYALDLIPWLECPLTEVHLCLALAVLCRL